MKVSQIFLCVIGIHLAVIAFLFATPGCNSGPEAETTGTSGVVGPPSDTVVTQANENYRSQSYTVNGTPVKTEAAQDVSRPRYPPTRPSWNLNNEQPADVIEGTEVEVIQPVNAINADPEVASVAATETSSYTVKKGDNLSVIARRNGVTLNELMQANSLNKQSVLQIGQTLVIPAPATPSYDAPSGELGATSAGSVGESGTSYTVKPGDSLSVIARRHSTSVRAIKSANNLPSDRIIVGQELLIPAGGGSVSSSSGASSSSAAPLPEGAYLVKRGDTLGGIAKRYGVKVSELMTANNISDPRSLRAGQTLNIPGVGSNSPAPTSRSNSSPAPRAPAAPSPSAPSAPAPAPAVIEEYNADILLENLDDIPAAEAQSTN